MSGLYTVWEGLYRWCGQCRNGDSVVVVVVVVVSLYGGGWRTEKENRVIDFLSLVLLLCLLSVLLMKRERVCRHFFLHGMLARELFLCVGALF